MSETVFLHAVQLYYVKCNPTRPSARMDPKKPQWEAQIRTTDQATAKRWEGLGLSVKFVIPEGKGPAEGYFRANLSKRALKSNGEPAMPVEVVTGALKDLDPDTIGNGSVANIRLLQRSYTNAVGQTKLTCMLVGIQVTHLIPYVGGTREGFGEADFTVEEVEDNGVTGTPVEDFVPTVATAEPPKFAGRSSADF